MNVFKVFYNFFLLILVSLPIFSADLSIEGLKLHYGDLHSLSAEVEQKKTAAYLFKPLVSKILLNYTPEIIRWEIISPVRTTVLIDSKGLKISDAEGTSSAGMPQDEKTKLLVDFFRSLFSLDFKSIEKNFVLTFKGMDLVATPKDANRIPYIQKLKFSFQKNLDLSRLVIEASDEKMEMKFSKVVLKK